MTRKDLLNRIYGLDACQPALEWVDYLEVDTAEQVWDMCPRGDWMLWLAAAAGVDRATIVRAACACARHALVNVSNDKGHARFAIEAAELWVSDPGRDNAAVASAASQAAYDEMNHAERVGIYAASEAIGAAADVAESVAAEDLGLTTHAALNSVADSAAYAAAGESLWAKANLAEPRSVARLKNANTVRGIIPWMDIKKGFDGNP